MNTDQANLDTNGGNSDHNADGSNSPAWCAQLEGDLQRHERLTSFRTISDMGKALIDAEGKLTGAIFPPGEKATDEEKAAFFNKIGRPEGADKYGFSKPSDYPEGAPYAPEMEAAYKQVAFSAGLSEAQASALFAWYNSAVAQGFERQAQEQKSATDKALNQLKDQWKGDEFKVNVDLAARTFKQYAGEDAAAADLLSRKIDGLTLGDHPTFVRLFASIGKTISDDTLNVGKGGQSRELSDEEKARQLFPNTQWKT